MSRNERVAEPATNPTFSNSRYSGIPFVHESGTKVLGLSLL